MTFTKIFSAVSGAGVVLAVSFSSLHAIAQPAPAPVPVFPPPEYVATTEPVYYEGHAAYWFGNRWYYRDERGGWQFYQNEPQVLAERRAHFQPVRHDYGRHDEHGRRR